MFYNKSWPTELGNAKIKIKSHFLYFYCKIPSGIHE